MNELRYNGMYNIEYDSNGRKIDYEKRLGELRIGSKAYTVKEKENKSIKHYGETKEMKTEITEQRLNLLDVMNRVANRIALTPQQEELNQRATQKANENGMNAIGMYNIEFRDLVNNTAITNTKRAETQSGEIDDTFLSKITFYPNLKANLKAPYFDESTCQWVAVGNAISANTDTITSEYLTPHRLATKTDFSMQILRQSGSFYNEVNEILLKAIYNKLVASILSDSAETEDQPKGIFNGLSATTISAITDLATLQYNGDKQKTNNVWIISPKAKAEILKLNPTIFNDGKFLGSDFILENRMQDGLIAYLPLHLITVAQFGAVSITLDSVTDAIHSNVKTCIDSFWDFNYLDNTKIQLGVFE